MEQRDDRADGEGQLKPEGHVNQDSENTDTERPKGISRQLAADQGADTLLPFNFELPIGNVFLDRAIDLLARVNRRANGDEVTIPFDRLLNRFVIEMNRLERFANLRNLHAFCRAQREQIAALEIDAEITIATDDEGRRPRDQQS